MEIVKATNNAVCPLLNKRELEFVEAASSPAMLGLEQEYTLNELLKIINRAYAELQRNPAGLNANERQRFMLSIAKMMWYDCKMYFPLVTIPEISAAVSRGIRKEYGPSYGFNNVIIHGFIKSYLESEDRLQAMAKQRRFLSPKEINDTEGLEEKWITMKKGIITCYTNYKKSKRIIDFGNVNYDILEKAGAINLGRDEKMVIYEVAKMQLLKEKENEAISYRMAYQFRQESMHNDIHVKARAKEIALKNFYDTSPDLEAWMDKLYEAFKAMDAEQLQKK